MVLWKLFISSAITYSPLCIAQVRCLIPRQVLFLGTDVSCCPFCITPKSTMSVGLKLFSGEFVSPTLYFLHNCSCYVLCIFSGRRSCLGQQLSRQELFIYIATMLHRFKMTLPEGAKANYNSADGFMLKPRPFQVTFESRLWCLRSLSRVFYEMSVCSDLLN